MKQFLSRILNVVLFLCLVEIESGVCQLGAADPPFFEKGRIHSSDGGDFAINAYPVIAPLPNGDLFCVWTAGQKRGSGQLSHCWCLLQRPGKALDLTRFTVSKRERAGCRPQHPDRRSTHSDFFHNHYASYQN